MDNMRYFLGIFDFWSLGEGKPCDVENDTRDSSFFSCDLEES